MVLDLENAESIFINNKEVKQLKIGNTVIWKKQTIESIILSSTKYILSLADNDSAVITAQIADEDHNPIAKSGNTIDFIINSSNLLYHYNSYEDAWPDYQSNEYVQSSPCTFYWKSGGRISSNDAPTTIICLSDYCTIYDASVVSVGDDCILTWDGSKLNYFVNGVLHNECILNQGVTANDNSWEYDDINVICDSRSTDFCVFSGVKNNPVYYETSVPTNANGQANVSLQSEGAGDLNIKAKYGSISTEIYVEDCIIYDPNSYTSDTIKSWSNIPTNFKLSYTGKRTSNGVLWIEVGSDANNNIFGGIISDRGYIGAYSRKNNSYEYSYYTSDALSVAEHEIIMIADGGNVTVNSENLTAQISGSTITARNWQRIHLTGSGGYIKNIKIKPL